MRTITIDLSDDSSQSYSCICGGNENEHNETLLEVNLPARLLDNEIDYYCFDFETADGRYISSTNIFPINIDNGKISVKLWEQLTQIEGKLDFCITAYKLDGNNNILRRGKTKTGTLLIKKSPSGKVVSISSEISADELQTIINDSFIGVKTEISNCANQAQTNIEESVIEVRRYIGTAQEYADEAAKSAEETFNSMMYAQSYASDAQSSAIVAQTEAQNIAKTLVTKADPIIQSTTPAVMLDIVDSAEGLLNGIKVVGKTHQDDGTPTPDNPISIQCVKAGTKIKIGKSQDDTSANEITVPTDLYEGDIWYPLTGKVVKENKIYTLDPSKILQIWNNETGVNYVYVVSIDDSIYGNTDSHFVGVCSEIYTPLNYNTSDNTSIWRRRKDTDAIQYAVAVAYSLGAKDRRILIKHYGLTLNEFKQYATDNPINIIYKLDTPVIEQYEPQQLKTFYPSTVIYNAEYTEQQADIQVDYTADTKTYIDNKFAELQALILEGK